MQPPKTLEEQGNIVLEELVNILETLAPLEKEARDASNKAEAALRKSVRDETKDKITPAVIRAVTAAEKAVSEKKLLDRSAAAIILAVKQKQFNLISQPKITLLAAAKRATDQLRRAQEAADFADFTWFEDLAADVCALDSDSDSDEEAQQAAEQEEDDEEDLADFSGGEDRRLRWVKRRGQQRSGVSNRA